MDNNSNYKIFKYKFKLKNAIGTKKYKDINKYYSHLKFHIIQGGAGTAHDFEKPDEYLKSNDIEQLQNSLDEIRLNFLKNVCIDSDECIGFGKEIITIKDFFGNFDNFDYAKNFKQIGNSSANGFNKSITYERDGYISNAILKSSKQAYSDNLYYEYLVGKFLNEQSKYFSCFIETYNIFRYINNIYSKIELCDINNDCNVDYLKKGLMIIKTDNIDMENILKFSCIRPTGLALLIQSLKNAKTIGDILKNGLEQLKNNTMPTEAINFCNSHLLYVLFQIYMPLNIMKDNFTHYDLHHNNVIVYEPSNGKVIKYCYHIKPTSSNEQEYLIEFYSPYIAKIIDYGRCYFNNGVIDSKNVYDKICTIDDCNERARKTCGNNKGYGWLNPPKNTLNLVSSQKNFSYDLRLLWGIFRTGIYEKIPHGDRSELSIINRKLNYNEGSFIAENMTDNLNINNVTDAFNQLKSLILLKKNKLYNEALFNGQNLIGELHIYSDNKTPIRFEEFKDITQIESDKKTREELGRIKREIADIKAKEKMEAEEEERIEAERIAKEEERIEAERIAKAKEETERKEEERKEEERKEEERKEEEERKAKEEAEKKKKE
jgi:hypothetical protein